MKPTHFSLFSGIGGLDIAAEIAGFQTVGQCELADYPTKILEKHWPDVPRWRDIRTITQEAFYERTGMHTVDIISGGFPCQPFSVAGKQRGKEDDRYLWPEMLRVVRELAPRWVVGENVPGILRLAAADVIESLEREGYHAVVFAFEAAAVGAPHRRERIAFVAQRDDSNGLQKRHGEAVSDTIGGSWTMWRHGEFSAVKSALGMRRDNRGGKEKHERGQWRLPESRVGGMDDGLSDWLDRGMSVPGKWMPDPHPDISRTATGIPHRSDRLKCLGNAVAPQQFYPIFRAIRQELLWEV